MAAYEPIWRVRSHIRGRCMNRADGQGPSLQEFAQSNVVRRCRGFAQFPGFANSPSTAWSIVEPIAGQVGHEGGTRQDCPGAAGWNRPGGGRHQGQAAYFSTSAPTAGSAASMCLPAPPRTALYALTIASRWDRCAISSVPCSRASDTSSPRLAR